MEKYKYVVHINKHVNTPYIEYTYTFGNTKDIHLTVGEQTATIQFFMSVLKEPEDLVSFDVKLFRDAYRKILLLHLLENKTNLVVENILIQTNTRIKLFDSKTDHFPFLFSMVSEGKLYLGKEWSSDYFRSCLLVLTKSSSDHDLRYSSLSAFLVSRNKKYQIEEFTSLWTSLNAYYNYIAQCFEKSFSSKNSIKNSDIPKLFRLMHNDSKSITAMMMIYKEDAKLMSRADRDKRKSAYKKVEKIISSINKIDINDLYEHTYNSIFEESEQDNRLICEIKDEIKSFNLPVFLFLLLDFPYYLRCNYIHGNTSTLMFSAFNDVEISLFGVINCFISRFLNENIPRLFDPEYFTEENYKTILYSIWKNATDKEKKGIKNNMPDLYKEISYREALTHV